MDAYVNQVTVFSVIFRMRERAIKKYKWEGEERTQFGFTEIYSILPFSFRYFIVNFGPVIWIFQLFLPIRLPLSLPSYHVSMSFLWFHRVWVPRCSYVARRVWCLSRWSRSGMWHLRLRSPRSSPPTSKSKSYRSPLTYISIVFVPWDRLRCANEISQRISSWSQDWKIVLDSIDEEPRSEWDWI